MTDGTGASRLARIAVAASVVTTLILVAPTEAQTPRHSDREGIQLRGIQREGNPPRTVLPRKLPCVRGSERDCIPDQRQEFPSVSAQPASPPCIAGNPDAPAGTWALEGTLLTPDKVIDDGVIVISGQKIASVRVAC